MCGGRLGENISDQCFKYAKETNTWEEAMPLQMPRFYPAVVQLNDNEIWIGGKKKQTQVKNMLQKERKPFLLQCK